jgi:FtsH-binding integral membrane protein
VIFMTKIKWWLYSVGGFYLLLAVGSFWVLFVNPNTFGSMFPFADDNDSIRAFSDAWLIFVLEMVALGGLMFYASREPERSRTLVLTVAILELIRGAGGDLLWMSRGWPTANYIPFMIVHILIGVSGIWFLRQETVKLAV